MLDSSASSARPAVPGTRSAPQSSCSGHLSKTPLHPPTVACLNHSRSGTATAEQTRPDVPSRSISPSAGREINFQELVAMGYSAHRVAFAIEQCAGQTTGALELLLLETPEQADRQLGLGQCLEATSHSSAADGSPTARATSPMSACRSPALASRVERPASDGRTSEHSQSVGAAGSSARKRAMSSMSTSLGRSFVLASRIERPASDERPLKLSQGARTAQSSVRERDAESIRAPVARAGYTSCPRCAERIPNQFFTEHLEFVCTVNPVAVQPPEGASADPRGLGTSVAMGSPGGITVPASSERNADGIPQAIPDAPPPAASVMQGPSSCTQAELLSAGWHGPSDAVTYSDVVHQPSDECPGAGPAGCSDGERSPAIVPRPIPAEGEEAFVVPRSESIASRQLGPSDFVASPVSQGLQSLGGDFPASQAVLQSRSGAGLMDLPCTSLDSAPSQLAPLFDTSDPLDVNFRIHTSQLYNRGQWRGGDSTSLQLLQNPTFRVPETPNASQCAAEADALPDQNPPAVGFGHCAWRQETQL